MKTFVEARCRGALVLAGATALVFSTAFSQGHKSAGVVSAVDTFVVVVPVRAVDDVRHDIEVIDAYRERAKDRLADLKVHTQKLESDIEVKGQEISLLEARRDAAEKEKNGDQVSALNAQIDGVKRLRDLLKERGDLYSAQVASANAALDYAGAAGAMYDKEVALAKKREELGRQAGAGGASAAFAGSNQTLIELENGVLEAQIQKLKKQEESLSADKDVAEMQQKIAKLQSRFLGK